MKMKHLLELQKIVSSWQDYALREVGEAKARRSELRIVKDLANAIVGVRRSGKTTIALQNALSLSQKVLYINFEDPYFSEFNQVSILDEIIEAYFEVYNFKPEIILFDEIHNIENWERWARKFVDQKRGLLILTGSSAKMLSSDLSTAVTGRNLTSEVWPLSFSEYLKFLEIKESDHQSAFANFVKWGGFPRIVLETDVRTRTEILNQYYSDTTLKDVVKRNEIRDVTSLLAVFNYYLTNIASLHSYNSVRKAFGLSPSTPQAYLHALTEAFLIFEVKLYSRNLKVQARNPSKVYAIDTGFRNANATTSTEDRGKLLENFVYLEYRKCGKKLYYHKDNFECDFLIVENYQVIQVIQVTETLRDPETEKRELAGLTEAMSHYKLKKGLLITMHESGILRLPQGTIEIVSAWKYFSAEFK